MAKEKVTFIDYSHDSKCYRCEGKGYEKNSIAACKTCNGTGKWTEQRFVLVATTPEGQKIGFEVDSPGK